MGGARFSGRREVFVPMISRGRVHCWRMTPPTGVNMAWRTGRGMFLPPPLAAPILVSPPGGGLSLTVLPTHNFASTVGDESWGIDPELRAGNEVTPEDLGLNFPELRNGQERLYHMLCKWQPWLNELSADVTRSIRVFCFRQVCESARASWRRLADFPAAGRLVRGGGVKYLKRTSAPLPPEDRISFHAGLSTGPGPTG